MSVIDRRLFLGALAAELLRGQDDADAIYKRSDWLALRRVTSAGSPALHRAAVATAFHRVREAEGLLKPILRGGGPNAIEACEHLINLRIRQGKFRAALEIAETAQKLAPTRSDFANARELFSGLAQFPEMKVRKSKRSLFVSPDGGVGGEISINGHRASYFWDTGADFSLTTESEVRRLGLPMLQSKATIGNSAGGRIGFQVALAPRVRIGECELENVLFFVIGDDQPPFNTVSQEERGLIGLPVQFALGGFRWRPNGETEVGYARDVSSGREQNLCFNGLKPLTEFRFRGTPLTGQFDTGAVNTDLWPPFARRFPDILDGAKREKRTIEGIGGSKAYEGSVLERVPLEVGGKAVVLAPADLYLEKIDSASEKYYGNIGIDLLRQAARVTVDFRSMRLTLE